MDGILTIARCSARGDVTSVGTSYYNLAGGFAGTIDSPSIVDCYAWGDVSNASIYGYTGSFCGGCWPISSGTMTNCYAIGDVTGNTGLMGGIIGSGDANITGMTSIFWDTNTSGTEIAIAYKPVGFDPDPATYTGHITEWMQTRVNYTDAGWDFDDVWEMTEAYVSADITATKLTFVSPFPHEIVTGDRYCVSGVPFKARCWPLQDKGVSRFNRWDMVGGALKCRKLSGFDSNDNAYWRLSIHRGNKKGLETLDTYVDVTKNPADSAGALNLDGVDIEPYIEQIAAGVSFELTNAEFNVSWTDSREVTDG